MKYEPKRCSARSPSAQVAMLVADLAHAEAVIAWQEKEIAVLRSAMWDVINAANMIDNDRIAASDRKHYRAMRNKYSHLAEQVQT